jgi:O-antigen biosynthesis protein WbqP
MKRLFDISLSLALCVIFICPCIVIAIAIKFTSKGAVLYWSDRVGQNNQIFKMPKFRTMKINTPEVASHLLINSSEALTSIGKLLRRYSLDEIPQLWSIMIGKMSFVGPRPALFNQNDLVALRSKYFIDGLVPGLTGWAQVNGRDELSIEDKVEKDLEYFKKRSFIFDLKILWLTVIRVFNKEGISH